MKLYVDNNDMCNIVRRKLNKLNIEFEEIKVKDGESAKIKKDTISKFPTIVSDEGLVYEGFVLSLYHIRKVSKSIDIDGEDDE